MSRIERAKFFRAAALAFACAALAAGCGDRGDGKAGGAKGALYHYRLAAEKYREGDFDAAIGIYEKTLQMNPKLAEAHLDLGIIYDDYKASKDKAVEHYRAFLALEPRSAKAEMVRRWIIKAGDEKGAAAPPGVSAEPPPFPRAEGDRAREDLAILRAENEAYLKTVEALRNELTQARQEIAALQASGPRGAGSGPAAAGPPDVEGKGPAALSASGWEAEKAQLWERYRGEKGRFDRALETLKEEVAHLQAQKAASDDALKKAHVRLAGAGKAAEGRAPASAEGLSAREIESAQERIREIEKKSSASLRDRDALAAKLKDAERRLNGYRMQASSDSPLLLSKVKADAEREREDLRKFYEKKFSDSVAGFARERGELQRELSEARRAAGRGPSVPASTPEPSQAAARMKADAERERAELRQYYERKLAEAAGTAGREKTEMQKELSESQREAAYLKAQTEKARAIAGKSEQYTAGAMERLREQFRREKTEMEGQFRRDREQLLARVNAQRAKAPAAVPVPAPTPVAARSSPSVSSGQGATLANRRAGQPAASRWVEPGARKPAAPPAATRRHRTAKGDTLRSLAQRFYGSPGRWKSIYDANRDTLQGQSASSALRPGWILVIP
ncbi:MAG: hypothetical protein WCP22_01390 [Chlamydiota bacterium]